MWILPKQLISDFVRDTEALNLDLNESSQLCAQSLFVRSKLSPARTWLRKWKTDYWSQHLYGQILKPSLGKAFETAWTSLLEVTPANHSPQQGSEQERVTQDTSGLGSQTEFGFCDQECVSLKMSKDTSRWDSPASSATWKSWVTRCRGEYSARVKLAHPTSASGCSSWPTTVASDWKGCGNAVMRKDGKHRLDKLEAVVIYGKAAWQTPTTNMDMVRSEEGIQKRKEFRASIGRKSIPDGNLGEKMQRVIKHGPPAPANPSTHGSRQESWATPRSCSAMAATITQESASDPKRFPNLETQVGKQWAMSIMGDSHLASTPEVAQKRIKEGKVTLSRQMAAQWATPATRDTQGPRGKAENERKGNPMNTLPNQLGAKLNPRWVETLMGLPIGWTMPSCTRPVTIARTNCDSSETESCQQPQSEHLELF